MKSGSDTLFSKSDMDVRTFKVSKSDIDVFIFYFHWLHLFKFSLLCAVKYLLKLDYQSRTSPALKN